MKKKYLERWHRSNIWQHNQIWISDDLRTKGRRSQKAHNRVVRNIKRRYNKIHHELLVVLRSTSKNCFKKLTKRIRNWRRIRLRKLRLQRIRRAKFRKLKLRHQRNRAYLRWLRDNKIWFRRVSKQHSNALRWRYKILRERTRHWRILYSKKRLSKIHLRALLRN